MDCTSPISEIEKLATVSSGVLRVNGVAISLDVNNDSVQDVVDHLNASTANVLAEFDSRSNRLTITGKNYEYLELDSGGIGSFEALPIDPGSHQSTSPPFLWLKAAQLSEKERRAAVDAMEDVSDAVNGLFQPPEFGPADTALAAVREQLAQAIKDKVSSNNGRDKTSFGLEFDFDPSTNDVLQFSSCDRARLPSKLETTQDVA